MRGLAMSCPSAKARSDAVPKTRAARPNILLACIALISNDLFGKPRGEARPDRLVKVQGAHNRVERAVTRKPEDLPTETAPQLADPPGHTLSKSGGDSQPGLSAADQASNQLHALPSAPNREDIHGGSTTPSPVESEMLSRAIGMIRSALVKEQS